MHTAMMRSLVLCGSILLSLVTYGTTVAEGQECDADSVYPDKKELRQLFKKGKNRAQEDLAQNRLVYKHYGLPRAWDRTFAKLMKNRFDVVVRHVGGDVVYSDHEALWKGYNCVSEAEIRRRFGKGVIDSTYQYAKKHYPSKHAINPEVLKRAQYTTEARRDSVEGYVYVSFGIPPSGTPRELEVVQGLGHGLDEEALRVVRKLRFRPAERIEKDTVIWRMQTPVKFTLTEKE